MSPAAPGMTPTKLAVLLDLWVLRRALGWSVEQLRAEAGDPRRRLDCYTTPQLRALERRLAGGPQHPPRPAVIPTRDRASRPGDVGR